MSNLTEWADGSPPCNGWWNASYNSDPTARRWWNGAYWSAPCYVGDPDEIAERAKSTRGETQVGIKWRGLTREPS